MQARKIRCLSVEIASTSACAKRGQTKSHFSTFCRCVYLEIGTIKGKFTRGNVIYRNQCKYRSIFFFVKVIIFCTFCEEKKLNYILTFEQNYLPPFHISWDFACFSLCTFGCIRLFSSSEFSWKRMGLFAKSTVR